MSLQSDWRLEGTEFDSASALCGFGVSQVNFGDQNERHAIRQVLTQSVLDVSTEFGDSKSMCLECFNVGPEIGDPKGLELGFGKCLDQTFDSQASLQHSLQRFNLDKLAFRAQEMFHVVSICMYGIFEMGFKFVILFSIVTGQGLMDMNKLEEFHVVGEAVIRGSHICDMALRLELSYG